MDSAVITDLKHFITETVAGQANELRKGIQRVERKIDNLFVAVADALDTMNNETTKQLDNHERRISRLERHCTK